MGTLNCLEIARNYFSSQNCPENFIFHHVSTDEVYGSLPNDPDIKFREETPYDPRSPYSASKASSDHLVRAWYETYGLPIVLTNCSNNYGPYHFPEKLIPRIIINALSEQPLPVYGDGSNIRDWLYVDDHAEALMIVLQKGKVGRSYNIGGNSEHSNLEIVMNICKILDRLRPRSHGRLYSELVCFVDDRPGHDFRYAIDTTRIHSELGWSPKVNLQTGLLLTVKWYLENQDWWMPLMHVHDVDQRLGLAK
jgi:dTDP-glucose 4,6-dehydratase